MLPLTPSTPSKSPRAILWYAVSDPKQAKREKISLAEQEAALRRVAAEHGWEIVDTITIPGFSRNWYTYREFADAAADEGIESPMRMFDHWEKRDFDIFAVWDGSRFARELSVFAEVVLRTVDAGAEMYDHHFGIVNEQNAYNYATMGGFAAAMEVRKLKEREKHGKQKRFDDKLPTSSRLPFSHLPIYNERRRVIGAKVNPAYRRLWDDLLKVMLDGVGWGSIPNVLANEYGHVRPNGRPYRSRTLYQLVLHPMFHGHHARHFTSGKDGDERRLYGYWAFDKSIPPPEGVEIEYDVFPAVYTGDDLERFKAEMHRRRSIVVGTARPIVSNPFTGLLVCGGCGWRLTYQKNTYGREYYCCENSRRMKQLGSEPNCESTRRCIRFEVVQEWFDNILRRMIAQSDPNILLQRKPVRSNTARIEALEREIADVEARARKLLLDKATTPPELQSILGNLIDEAGAQLTVLKGELAKEKRNRARERSDGASRQLALGELATMGIEAFWAQSPHRINQILSQLLGNRNVVVMEGEITDIIPSKRRKARTDKKHKD